MREDRQGQVATRRPAGRRSSAELEVGAHDLGDTEVTTALQGLDPPGVEVAGAARGGPDDGLPPGLDVGGVALGPEVGGGSGDDLGTLLALGGGSGFGLFTFGGGGDRLEAGGGSKGQEHVADTTGVEEVAHGGLLEDPLLGAGVPVAPVLDRGAGRQHPGAVGDGGRWFVGHDDHGPDGRQRARDVGSGGQVVQEVEVVDEQDLDLAALAALEKRHHIGGAGQAADQVLVTEADRGRRCCRRPR